jgi:cytochrome c biogenesis protein CcmG, thiol:disulfide interchange protein DsbE
MAPKLPWILGLAALAVVGVGVARLPGGGGTASSRLTPLTTAQAQTELLSSPGPLAALHARADALLDGGAPALHAELAALRGLPVVVNKWASWCESCQAERLAFQHAAAGLGRQVAFLGIDSGDHSRADAAAFLRAAPDSYPSYYDPSAELGTAVTDSSFMPVTVFYSAHGRQFIHQGPYLSLAELERDVRHYALDADHA